ncbi:hypothetical protein ACED16_01400 [Enterobacter hormaechei]
MPHPTVDNHKNIISAMLDFAVPAKHDRLSKGKQLYDMKSNAHQRVYLLLDGAFIVRSCVGGKVMSLVMAPFVFGAMPALDYPVYLEKIGYGKIYSISYTDFWNIIKNKDLLPDVMSTISSYHSDLINYLQIHHVDSETHVKLCMERWNKLPDGIKKHLSLTKFVLTTSFLSKSTILRFMRKIRESENNHFH